MASAGKDGSGAHGPPKRTGSTMRKEEKEEVLASLVKAIRKLESDLKLGGTCAALNCKSSDLLSEAILKSERKKARKLLMEEPLLVNSLDTNGSTPLHLAAQQGDAKMGQDLIDMFCASVNLCDVNGNTPLDIVLMSLDKMVLGGSFNSGDVGGVDPAARYQKMEAMLRWRGGTALSQRSRSLNISLASIPSSLGCSQMFPADLVHPTCTQRDMDMSEPMLATEVEGGQPVSAGAETLLLRPPEECCGRDVEFTDPNSSNPVVFRCTPEEGVFYYEIRGKRRPSIKKIEFGEKPPRLMFPNIGTSVTLPDERLKEILEAIRAMAECVHVPHGIPNVVQLNRRDTLHWNVDTSNMALVFMGLPGRGRTFMAQRLCRWLNWKGVRARLFSAAAARDPTQRRRSDNRENASVEAMIEFFGMYPGSVGMLGCNSALPHHLDLIVERLVRAGVMRERVIFIDTCTTDSRMIRANVLGKPEQSDPKLDTEEEKTRLVENEERVQRAMRTRYQSLSEHTTGHLSFIHLSTTTYPCKSEKVVLNKITGHLCQKLLFFLLNLHPASSTTYLVRTGECLHQVANKVGGDSELTASGWQHAAAVRRFFNQKQHKHERMQVFSSSMKRALETASCFRGKRFSKVQYKSLNEINAGAVDGMTTEQIREKYPDVWSKRARDKYYYGWPKGESYSNMNQRLEQVILDLHRSPDPVLVIGHLDVCRGLLAYVSEWLPELCVYLSIPQHCIYEFNYDVKTHSMGIVCHDISEDVAAAKHALISSNCRPRKAFLEAVPTSKPKMGEPPRLPDHIRDIMSANPLYHPAQTDTARHCVSPTTTPHLTPPTGPLHHRSLSGDFCSSPMSSPALTASLTPTSSAAVAPSPAGSPAPLPAEYPRASPRAASASASTE
eukprot:TRINITY_DN10562_c0_g1_i1.p1 TRINITY_DN10562_c0_g1~~TRINITY_DN10562_c0_g1_i1.p1  ORF type:complete len:894 (+),score=286.48 TRINITY_DN10562_c0_g1_i1:61-2742(+)